MRILTNGTFDLLHAGHVYFLSQIKKRYPKSFLNIAVRSDEAAERKNGYSPIIGEYSRIYMLQQLKMVDYAFKYDGDDISLDIFNFEPDIYFQSKNTLTNITPDEWGALIKIGAKVEHTKYIDDISTKILIDKIKNS